MKTALASLLLAAVLVLPGASHAAGLQCGNRLVTEGATQDEVRSRCGEPASRSTRQEAVRTPLGTGTDAVALTTFEEWTYNFGPNRFQYTVVFQNGLLVDVRSGRPGY